jgi:pyruvate formate lyase activating enzyme
MAECSVCYRQDPLISARLGVCLECLRTHPERSLPVCDDSHQRVREEQGLPVLPPDEAKGRVCRLCVNACRIGDGGVGFCGVRRNEGGQLRGGTSRDARVSWYHDPLPTNCVADWVCAGGSGAGYPEYAYVSGPEYGYKNLAVFYHGCSFDCLNCQNWQHRELALTSPKQTSQQLASAVTDSTSCICYFGGDPTPQVVHALHAARLARGRHPGRILRICWETNGNASADVFQTMMEISLESGGCVKVDCKAWTESVHKALTGRSNRQALRNIEAGSKMIVRRPDPPPLVVSTLLVPGYIDSYEVGRIAGFLAGLDPTIPYALLGFHPDFVLNDLPLTSRRHAEECYQAACDAGLTRVRLGNLHLLGRDY